MFGFLKKARQSKLKRTDFAGKIFRDKDGKVISRPQDFEERLERLVDETKRTFEVEQATRYPDRPTS